MGDYVEAIKRMRETHRGRALSAGVGYSSPHGALGAARDLAPGNSYAMVFRLNGMRRTMLFFNANNMLPSLREDVIAHVKRKFGLTAEVYTTDTHYVNSLDKTASNVLGRYTTFKMLEPFVDRAVSTAVLNIEPVKAYHRRSVIRNFLVWGPNIRERMGAVISSMFGLARVVVPLLIAVGFVAAAWLITIV
jgi:predicted neutral ceramidase superfamily lipid hydrolase